MGFKNYDQNQMKMYTSIVNAVKKAANLVGIKKIIPSGTAIQNARTSFIGDHMNRDGYHLDLTIGRYTAACTWFEALTHQNVWTQSIRKQLKWLRTTPSSIRTKLRN